MRVGNGDRRGEIADGIDEVFFLFFFSSQGFKGRKSFLTRNYVWERERFR